MPKVYTTEDHESISFDGKSYPVEDGAVDVPPEAIETLIQSHGFTLKNPNPPVREKKAVDVGSSSVAQTPAPVKPAPQTVVVKKQ